MIDGASVVVADSIAAAYHELGVTEEQYFNVAEFFIDVLRFMRAEHEFVAAVGAALADAHDQAVEHAMSSDYLRDATPL